MEGVLLVERRSLLGAVNLVEGVEEFSLTLNLNYQVDFFSYVGRLRREKCVLKIEL